MIINTLWGEEELESKICSYCKEEKLLDEFHFRYYDGKRTSYSEHRCKKCFSHGNKIRKNLYKVATPKSDHCQCCGKQKDINGNVLEIHLDHDRETEKFRGWLCRPCNTAIGQLGDTLEGVRKAVRYLENSKENFL